MPSQRGGSRLSTAAANMEIGLLLGLTGQLAPQPLRRHLPALRLDAMAMLGMRDQNLRRSLNIA